MIETLSNFNTTSIGTKVMTNQDRPLDENGEVDWPAFDKMRADNPICIDHKTDMVSIKLMTKPVSEGGMGAQLTDFVELAVHILKGLNGFYPCKENSETILHWEAGLECQRERTRDRQKRNVEGQNKE